MHNKISAALFDLDGVITDTAEYHYLAWKRLAAELGIGINRAFNEQLKGISRDASLERILQLGGLQSRYSTEEKQQLAAQKNAYYLTCISTVTPANILPGISELLAFLQQKNVACAIASASRNAPFLLEQLGLQNAFAFVANPALVKRGKPFPDIFLAAAGGLHTPAPACIGIEDSEAGIEAIGAAGMPSVGVGPSNALAGATYRVPSTRQLSALFEALLV